ncbi:hypothetical protein [Paenibacillus sp. 1P07SE]|uniref:hypothetical protein n=1 Tax=Paenibacillus sp. 1P07SE TaxID=3132209 RepID=UPI0039A62005
MRLVKGLLAATILVWWPESCIEERAEPASVMEEVYPSPHADSVLRDVYGPSELRPQVVPERLYDGKRLLEED